MLALAPAEAVESSTESNATIKPGQSYTCISDFLRLTLSADRPSATVVPGFDSPASSESTTSSSATPAVGSSHHLFLNRHSVTSLERQELEAQGIVVGSLVNKGGQGSVHTVSTPSPSSPAQVVKKIIPTKYQESEISILSLLAQHPHPHLASSDKVVVTSFNVKWAVFPMAVGDLLARLKQNGGFSPAAIASISYDVSLLSSS